MSKINCEDDGDDEVDEEDDDDEDDADDVQPVRDGEQLQATSHLPPPAGDACKQHNLPIW